MKSNTSGSQALAILSILAFLVAIVLFILFIGMSQRADGSVKCGTAQMSSEDVCEHVNGTTTYTTTYEQEVQGQDTVRSNAPAVLLSAIVCAVLGLVFAWAARSKGKAEEAQREAEEAQRPLPQVRRIPVVATADEKLAGEALVQQAEAAIAQKPQNPSFYEKKARALYSLQRYNEALAAADEGLAVTPNFISLRKVRGQILLALGRYAEAVDYLEDYVRRWGFDERGKALYAEAKRLLQQTTPSNSLSDTL